MRPHTAEKNFSDDVGTKNVLSLSLFETSATLMCDFIYRKFYRDKRTRRTITNYTYVYNFKVIKKFGKTIVHPYKQAYSSSKSHCAHRKKKVFVCLLFFF